MKRFAALSLSVIMLVVAEVSMRPTPSERRTLYVLFLGAAFGTLALGVPIRLALSRLPTLRATVLVPPVAAVLVAAVVVGVAALTMFISPHDLQLVTVALLLGAGLGGFLGVALGEPLTGDLTRLAAAADQVAGGDLSARADVHRSDEVGRVAAAFDAMVERLATAQAEREGHERSRRSFLTGVGHDLRTPLMSLQAAVEALEDGMAPDPQRYLRSMSADLRALRGLVDDLFVLSRLEAGDLALRPVAIDLGELSDEVLETMRPLAEAKAVELSLVASPPHPVNVDPQAVARVIRNLVDNAVRHTPSGTRVSVEISEASGEVVVVVVDDGPGFSDGEGRAGSDGGRSGLGLPIAKRLIEAHGGTVWWEPGPGGRVGFRLAGA